MNGVVEEGTWQNCFRKNREREEGTSGKNEAEANIVGHSAFFDFLRLQRENESNRTDR